MITNQSKQKTSLRQKLVGGLVAVLSAVAPGCFTGGSVEGYVGSHAPTNQTSPNPIEFDNSVVTGIRGRAKTKSGVEVEVGYSGHKSSYGDVIEKHDLEVTDLSVGAKVPVFNKGQVTVHANAGLTSRTETDTLELVGFPGSFPEDRSSTGVYAGADVEWTPTKNFSANARLDLSSQSDDSYEGGAVTVSLGASYNF